jgi:uncharacterized membrane protein YfcA
VTLLDGTLLAVAAAAAGMVNSVAGGGTLLTFPALLAVSPEAKMANATSTVALWPGTMGSVYGYREDLAGARPFLVRMGIPSLIGGALGALLLLVTGKDAFDALVPWLVLFATLLFAFSGPLGRWFRRPVAPGETPPSPERPGKRALAFQFAVAVYGGYFGAGIGILMLAALSMLGLTDIHRMNGMKIFLGMVINSVAVVIFAVAGLVHWPEALLMAAAALAGGYAGARLARRIPGGAVRGLVIAVGLVVAATRFAALSK